MVLPKKKKKILIKNLTHAHFIWKYNCIDRKWISNPTQNAATPSNTCYVWLYNNVEICWFPHSGWKIQQPNQWGVTIEKLFYRFRCAIREPECPQTAAPCERLLPSLGIARLVSYTYQSGPNEGWKIMRQWFWDQSVIDHIDNWLTMKTDFFFVDSVQFADGF